MLSLKKDEDCGLDLFYLPLQPENSVWDKGHSLSADHIHWTVCGEAWEKRGGKVAENKRRVCWGENPKCFILRFQLAVSKWSLNPKFGQIEKQKPANNKKINKKCLYFFSSGEEYLLWLRIMFGGDRENAISVSKQKFFIFVSSALNTNIFSLFWEGLFVCLFLVQQTEQHHQLFAQLYLQINFVILMLTTFFFPK